MNRLDYYKYNVFISYAKPNKQEAEKFYHSIVSKGFNAFFAPLTLNLSEEEEFQKLSGKYEIRDGKVHFSELVIEYEFTTAPHLDSG